MPTTSGAPTAPALYGADRRATAIADLVRDTRLRLQRQFCDLIGELAEPTDESANETAAERRIRLTTGSETEPGAYYSGDDLGWVIWEHDPSSFGDTIAITQCGPEWEWANPAST